MNPDIALELDELKRILLDTLEQYALQSRRNLVGVLIYIAREEEGVAWKTLMSRLKELREEGLLPPDIVGSPNSIKSALERVDGLLLQTTRDYLCLS